MPLREIERLRVPPESDGDFLESHPKFTFRRVPLPFFDIFQINFLHGSTRFDWKLGHTSPVLHRWLEKRPINRSAGLHIRDALHCFPQFASSVDRINSFNSN